MAPGSKPFILPYEPNYTAHRDAEGRRLQIRKLVRAREAILRPSPPVVPDERDMIEPKTGPKKPSRD